MANSPVNETDELRIRRRVKEPDRGRREGMEWNGRITNDGLRAQQLMATEMQSIADGSLRMDPCGVLGEWVDLKDT